MNPDPVQSRERRREPRLEVTNPVAGQLLPFNTPVSLLNVSAGGLLIHSDTSLVVGAACELRFALPDEGSVDVTVRITHVLRLFHGDQVSFAMGGAFTGIGGVGFAAAVARLIRACELTTA
jgi:hypothetical protein